ncbi:MAG: MBL fold metallo-hydrolase RNA specificity domain-containing protein [Phycisphaerae bacterium]
MKITFLGANRQVTGSRHLLTVDGSRFLIDCGMFQEREFLGRNWASSPAPPGDLDGLLLTHAHLDHTGLLPRLVAEGFEGPIFTTAASRDLAEIILNDSAHIQEEDAAFKRKRHKRERRKGPFPVEPLYTRDDVQKTLSLFRTVQYGEPQVLNKHVSVTYRDAGHILGSAMLEVAVRRNGGTQTIVFSGDIGQRDRPLIGDPSVPRQADYVVMESTYGGRDHAEGGSVEEQLRDLINETVAAGGNLVIPTFAVERAQELMYFIGRLRRERRIPNVMVFLDSPMAVDTTEVFRRHRECMDEETREMLESGEPPLRFPGLKLCRTVGESKAINRIKGSCIILATSGMCTAGRIKHHLAANIGRRTCTLAFVGYQARGTLGRDIVNGRKSVRIHHKQYRVKARVAQIHGLSAHADHAGLLDWIGHLAAPPRRVFLTHGEVDAASQLAEAIRSRWGCEVVIPEFQDEHELD